MGATRTAIGAASMGCREGQPEGVEMANKLVSIGRLFHVHKGWIGYYVFASIVVAGSAVLASVTKPILGEAVLLTTSNTTSTIQENPMKATNEQSDSEQSSTSSASSSQSSSTSSSTNDGPSKVEVTVDGQTTTVEGDGNVNKTVTTPNGQATINITVDGSSNAASGAGNVSVHSYSSSTSNSSTSTSVNVRQSGQ